MSGKKDQELHIKKEDKNSNDNFSKIVKDNVKDKSIEWTKLFQFVKEYLIKPLKNWEESEMQEKKLNKT